MDIPPDFVSLNRYKASLAHKINHSFDPNCRWGVINHPTFGRVPRVVTMKDLKAGEVTCKCLKITQNIAFEWFNFVF